MIVRYYYTNSSANCSHRMKKTKGKQKFSTPSVLVLYNFFHEDNRVNELKKMLFLSGNSKKNPKQFVQLYEEKKKPSDL